MCSSNQLWGIYLLDFVYSGWRKTCHLTNRQPDHASLQKSKEQQRLATYHTYNPLRLHRITDHCRLIHIDTGYTPVLSEHHVLL